MNNDHVLMLTMPVLRPIARAPFVGRRAGFRALPPVDDRVLFVGDSITQAAPWEELLPDMPVANRGIGGDTTVDLLERVGEIHGHPRAISLLIGTNDLHAPRLRDIDGIAQRTNTIVEQLRTLLPDGPLIINAITPRTPLFAQRIHRLNELYRDLASMHSCAFIDTFTLLADPDGGLSEKFTGDKLHLTVPAYLEWARALRPHLPDHDQERLASQVNNA